MMKISVKLLLFLILLTGCASSNAATISGTVFRDLNANGIREAREPGEPDITVNVYDADDNFITSTTTNINGEYTLNQELDPAQIIQGDPYCVIFENVPAFLSSGPSGPDSGTELQFVTGGDANVSYGVFNPDQFVPAELQQE